MTMQDDVVFLGATQAKAAKYWAGDPGDPAEGYELLTNSSLRVVKALE